MAKCYRDQEKTGPHVFYARLEDNSTFEVNGEPAKFDFAEATLIEGGMEPQRVLARRKQIASAVVEAEPEKRSPGRPRKEG